MRQRANIMNQIYIPELNYNKTILSPKAKRKSLAQPNMGLHHTTANVPDS